jgi:hypothetical protein
VNLFAQPRKVHTPDVEQGSYLRRLEMRNRSRALIVALSLLLFSYCAIGVEDEAISFVKVGNEYLVGLASGELNLVRKTTHMPLPMKILKHGGGSWYRVRLVIAEDWQSEFWLNFDHVVTVQVPDSSKKQTQH